MEGDEWEQDLGGNDIAMRIDINHLTESELIDLNEKIVQRLRMIRQMRSHVQMLEFTIGERVWFQTDRQEVVEGMLVRYNKKSVTVVTDDGYRWTVSPGFLRKVVSSETIPEPANGIKREKLRRSSGR
jgi:biotin-(acetyl-CoA carboxylase) ligase